MNLQVLVETLDRATGDTNCFGDVFCFFSERYIDFNRSLFDFGDAERHGLQLQLARTMKSGLAVMMEAKPSKSRVCFDQIDDLVKKC